MKAYDTTLPDRKRVQATGTQQFPATSHSAFPMHVMLIIPWAATLEIEDLRIVIIDNDHSPSSERLVHRIEASPYFKLTGLPDTYRDGLEAIEKDRADMLLEIPRGFEKEQVNGRPASALVAVNAVNGTKGGLGSSYLNQILAPAGNTSIRYLFNPHLNTRITWFRH